MLRLKTNARAGDENFVAQRLGAGSLAGAHGSLLHGADIKSIW